MKIIGYCGSWRRNVFIFTLVWNSGTASKIFFKHRNISGRLGLKENARTGWQLRSVQQNMDALNHLPGNGSGTWSAKGWKATPLGQKQHTCKSPSVLPEIHTKYLRLKKKMKMLWVRSHERYRERYSDHGKATTTGKKGQRSVKGAKRKNKSWGNENGESGGWRKKTQNNTWSKKAMFGEIKMASYSTNQGRAFQQLETWPTRDAPFHHQMEGASFEKKIQGQQNIQPIMKALGLIVYPRLYIDDDHCWWIKLRRIIVTNL